MSIFSCMFIFNFVLVLEGEWKGCRVFPVSDWTVDLNSRILARYKSFIIIIIIIDMSAQEQPEGSSARPLTDLALVCISQAWPLVPQRWPFNSQDFIGNSPYCLPKDSHYVSLENLVSDQSVIPRVLELSFVLWFEAAICDNCVHIREVRVIVIVRELDTFLATN